VDKIFKALADRHRRLILTLLKDGNMSVSELLKYMDIRQATLSAHLAILKKANLVSSEVRGKNRIYIINYKILSRFAKEINIFVENDIIVARKVS
jgi:DNA-binding transcriptional ArsR family regulator